MSLRHAILGIVDWQPMHGYEIKRVLEEGVSTFWPVNLGAIYPSLRRLEAEGLVRHRREASPDGRPDRKVYEVTEAGREELARWRRLPPEGPPQTRVPLYLKLLFARPENLPEVVQWIDKELETARARADALRSALHEPFADPDALPFFFVQFMRESGLGHTELGIEFLEDLRARVLRRLEAGEAGHEGADRSVD